MTIAAYVRISTDKQVTVSQDYTIKEYCISHGYDLSSIAWYTDEDISGRTLNRPGFKSLLLGVTSGSISKIITFELSRFSRTLWDGVDVMRLFASHGVTVESPKEGVIKFDTATDQIIVALKMLVAQSERENISTRTKAGLAAARASGKVLGAPKGNTYTKGRRKVFDQTLVAKICHLRRRGHTLMDIAAVTAISHTTVALILKRATA